jgi:hypothetical protein
MSEQSSGQSPAQGWYTDPHDAARLRWWDGAAWTDHVHPPTGAETAATAQPAAAAQQATPAAAQSAQDPGAAAGAGGIVSNPAPAAGPGQRSAIAEWFSIRSNQILFLVLLVAIALFVYVMVGGAS